MGLRPRPRMHWAHHLPKYTNVEGRSAGEESGTNAKYQILMSILGALGGGLAGIPAGPAGIVGGAVSGGMAGYSAGSQMGQMDNAEAAARTKADQMAADNATGNEIIAIQMMQQKEAQDKADYLTAISTANSFLPKPAAAGREWQII